MSGVSHDLRRFCDRYGIDFTRLGEEGPAQEYIIDGAPPEWDGRLEALRLIGVGRFGNRVWQILNIVLIARHLGVWQVWFDDISTMENCPTAIEGLAFGLTPDHIDRPTLTGIFFSTSGFDPVLEPVDGSYADDTLRRFVVPFFGAFQPATRSQGDDVLVMHFRGGDLFPEPGEWVPSHYVMPPAAFYLAAFAYARAEFGVVRVCLVHEDQRNPAVSGVELALRERGIEVELQSGSLLDDVGTLLRATHLVAPFGTFCEGIAMLSRDLRSFCRFRDIESHMFLQSRPYSLLQAVLAARGVNCLVGIDTAPDYIPPFGWNASDTQRALLLSYPERDIAISEAPELPQAPISPRDAALAAARAETAWLRATLSRMEAPTQFVSPSMALAVSSIVPTGDGGGLRDFGRAMAVLQQPDGQIRIADFLASAFVADPDIGLLPRWLDPELEPNLSGAPVRSESSRVILENIRLLRGFRASSITRRVVVMGPEYDFLADTGQLEFWGLLRWLNMLAMRQIRPTRRAAAVLMARDEGINMLEWIAHHQAIGVQRIFVYTNDNVDGSDALLDALAAQDVITLIRHASAPGINVQVKVMQHALHLLPELRDYEWVLFLDADEFTIPAPSYDYDITRLIDAAQRARPDVGAILLPWNWRLWPHRFERQSGLTLVNFPHARPHILFKALVRLRACVSMDQVHTPLLDAGRPLLDSALAEIAPGQVWADTPKTFAGGWIEHFWAKSFVEFIIREIARRRTCDSDRRIPA